MFLGVRACVGFGRIAALCCASLAGTQINAMDEVLPQQKIVFFACSGPPEVCAALKRSLADKLGNGAEVREVAILDATPNRPGDLGVEVQMSLASQDALRGRLILHFPTPEPAQPGPEVGVEALDRSLSNSQISEFATDLIRYHNELQSARHVIRTNDQPK